MGCSDSSMDDCNGTENLLDQDYSKVQIPLWTIVTGRIRAGHGRHDEFRFLYGRL